MDLSFVKEIFSNDNGGGSSHRTGLLFTIAALLGWASVIVYRTTTIPDVPNGWAILIATLVGGMASGKVTEVYKAVKAPESTAPEQTPTE